MATHSSILAGKIPWTEEPGGLQSMVSQRVRHDWSDRAQSTSHYKIRICIISMCYILKNFKRSHVWNQTNERNHIENNITPMGPRLKIILSFKQFYLFIINILDITRVLPSFVFCLLTENVIQNLIDHSYATICDFTIHIVSIKICLMMKVKSNAVKNNTAKEAGMLGPWTKVNRTWSSRRWQEWTSIS